MQRTSRLRLGKVKSRLRMQQHARRISGNVSQKLPIFWSIADALLHLERPL